ncbi:hypothetical protein [Paenirhodobacter hankyongi]|uniref:Uncharacterized protein n=1 Tax=Paenirhodobacter hankyongi TaxID=2294033 RepID=A0A421BJ63_9RHOB|nr:hypothetical protein [Sinirhodobacter hankyongi]RLL61533.1 hypothetical protein DYS74_17990 [Sinirhodobacter hankyongi]
MDSAEQAAGEKRVRELLIEPLERRGLARPSSLTRAQYEEMCRDLCARLAYMTGLNLEALAEQVAANPAGKDRDRLPIANQILNWAGQIQPPREDGSPLIRAVFAADLGRRALAEGWAPELLRHLRETRLWPGSFAVEQVRERGREADRRMRMVREAQAAGRFVSEVDRQFLERRGAAVVRCEAIAEMVRAGGAA